MVFADLISFYRATVDQWVLSRVVFLQLEGCRFKSSFFPSHVAGKALNSKLPTDLCVYWCINVCAFV